VSRVRRSGCAWNCSRVGSGAPHGDELAADRRAQSGIAKCDGSVVKARPAPPTNSITVTLCGSARPADPAGGAANRSGFLLVRRVGPLTNALVIANV
jgi:hypothetical protein